MKTTSATRIIHWAGRHSSISIIDDGRGMSLQELRNAMRSGSRNPLEERSPEDLARLGLGLKTEQKGGQNKILWPRRNGCLCSGIGRWWGRIEGGGVEVDADCLGVIVELGMAKRKIKL
jgi:hypothetical protein